MQGSSTSKLLAARLRNLGSDERFRSVWQVPQFKVRGNPYHRLMGQPIPIRIIIVDDQPIIRIGFRAMLESAPDLEIAGEAGDGESGVALANELCPDVALVDVIMPRIDGYETAKAITGASPGTRIAMISSDFDERQMGRGMEIGVRGFILKTEDPGQMIAFIREVHRGKFCCSNGISSTAIHQPKDAQLILPRDSRLQSLNPHECAMLVELGKGASLKEAAKALGMRYKVADHLKQAVMNKLDLHDRAELVRYAIRQGLVS